jgi:hypothetical protein
MNNARRLPYYFFSLFVLFFCLPVIAQDTEKKSNQEKIDLSRALPKVRFHKPKLLMQDALKKAEEFIATNKISIDDFFLYRVTLIYASEKQAQPGWHFWWLHQEQAMGNYVEIFVSMDGQIRRLNSM